MPDKSIDKVNFLKLKYIFPVLKEAVFWQDYPKEDRKQ